MNEETWIDIAEAADLLGVHQSTLRRWADTGRIEHMRTLSGRRRFMRSTIEQAHQRMLSGPHLQAPEERLEDQTLVLARQQTQLLTTHPTDWFGYLDDDRRSLFRYSGKLLFGLMMHYISRSDPGDTYLAEGKRVARDYGQICFRAGLTIAQTTEAFLYFRRSVFDSICKTLGIGDPSDPETQRVITRTEEFFDTLLVATIETYAEMDQEK